jgi:hypothetical protein
MSKEQRDDSTKPSDELKDSEESNAKPEEAPHPTAQETAQEIEAEDRFEATDN